MSVDVEKAYDVYLNAQEWPVQVRGLGLKTQTDDYYFYILDAAEDLKFVTPRIALSYVVVSPED